MFKSAGNRGLRSQPPPTCTSKTTERYVLLLQQADHNNPSTQALCASLHLVALSATDHTMCHRLMHSQRGAMPPTPGTQPISLGLRARQPPSCSATTAVTGTDSHSLPVPRLSYGCTQAHLRRGPLLSGRARVPHVSTQAWFLRGNLVIPVTGQSWLSLSRGRPPRAHNLRLVGWLAG